MLVIHQVLLAYLLKKAVANPATTVANKAGFAKRFPADRLCCFIMGTCPQKQDMHGETRRFMTFQVTIS